MPLCVVKCLRSGPKTLSLDFKVDMIPIVKICHCLVSWAPDPWITLIPTRSGSRSHSRLWRLRGRVSMHFHGHLASRLYYFVNAIMHYQLCKLRPYDMVPFFLRAREKKGTITWAQCKPPSYGFIRFDVRDRTRIN